MILVEIALDGGAYEGADKKLVPDGVLRVAENVILRRDGQLEVRPADVAVSMTTYNDRSLEAFDLVNHDERLVALGDDNSEGCPTDIYTLVEKAQAWRPSGGGGSGVLRLPYASKLRDMGSSPDQDGSVGEAVAAVRDGVCVLPVRAVGGNSIFAHVFLTDRGRTLIYQRLSTDAADATLAPVAIVTTTGVFWIIGFNSASTRVGGYPYAPATDESIDTSGVNLDGPGTAGSCFAAAPIAGGSGGFVLAVARGAAITISIVDDAGTLQDTITGPAEAAAHMAIAADATANRVALMYLETSGFTYKLQTFNLTTGASVIGPTTLFGARTSSTFVCSLLFKDGDTTLLQCLGTSDAPQVEFAEVGTDTHSLSRQAVMADAVMTSSPALSFGDDVIFAWTHPDSASNHLCAIRAMDTPSFSADFVQLACKDFELASASRGSLTRDAATGQFYWGNLYQNNDAQLSAQVTEFALGSPDRRQMAVLGPHLYISGGCPSRSDGTTLIEQGFQERPRFTDALSSSDSTGQLTAGGLYTYALTWEWLDGERCLDRSPPSIFRSIQLDASHDTVDVPASMPHSNRCNNAVRGATGASVRAVLWRNTCTVTQTAGSLLTLPVDPPSEALDGLVFGVSVDGGSFQAFAFGSGDDDPAAIATTINSNTTGLTAVAEGSAVRITSDTQGSSSSLRFGGALLALQALGITLGQTVTGSRTVQPGPNMHRAAVANISVGDAYGAPITITDTLSDTVLRTKEVLYTQSQTPLPHHAPPPYEYVWPAGDALLIGGLPRRSEWARSKRLFSAEPVEFAEPGRLNFSGRANGDIVAVAVLDQANLLFTRSELQAIQGEGPDHSGLGEFFAPLDLPIDGGSSDFRPLLRIADGLFFQLDDAKLYLMQRGGASEWVGFAVQDTLEAFPVIVGAAHVRAQQHVCFACNTEAGDAGVILRYDLRRKIWFTHTVSGPLRSISSYQGRLAYVLATGAVMLADNAPGTGAFVDYRIQLGSFGGFQSLGYGELHKVGVLGEIRGACSVEARISYDDAQTFQTLDAFSVSGPAGTPLSKLWTPSRDRTDRFVLDLRVTGSSDSAGVRLSKIVFAVDKAPGLTRRGAGDLK
jgi:hypothetical protein